MAAIARFGFENGYVPSNVNVVMDGATGSAFVPGRNGGTCCEAKNEPYYGGYNGEQVMSGNAYVSVSFVPSNSVYFSCQLREVQDNYNQEFTLFSFGTISVTYNRGTGGQLKFYNIGTLLYTSAAVNFPANVWIPVSGKFVSSATSGEITVIVDGTNYSVSSVNTGGAAASSFKISLGSSKTINVYGIVRYGPPKFQVDDIAVNNGYNASNSTGSFGSSDSVIPSYISCRVVQYSTTGSNTSGWTSPIGDIISDITSTGSGYLTSSFLPRPVLELSPSQSISGVTTVEGINYFFGNSFREGSSNVYITPHFMLNDTSSVQADSTFQLGTVPRSGSTSVFEKDLGGKISYNEFLNGKIAIDVTQWMNKNFFGRGTLGDVRYTSSINLGDGTNEYLILEYNNLIIDSGVTISTSVAKKGLIIYVKENCIINGKISMTGKAPAYSAGIPNLANGFVLSKNTSSLQFSETGSILNSSFTLTQEQQFQPYINSMSSMFNIGPTYSTVGTSANGTTTQCGAGGTGYQGSSGTPSTSYGGGSGGGGSSGDYGNGAIGGGVIYLIVGKNIVFNGTMESNGNSGLPNLGGGGGGCITVLYGKNYIGSGTYSVLGGGSFMNPQSGNGSVRISKILTF